MIKKKAISIFIIILFFTLLLLPAVSPVLAFDFDVQSGLKRTGDEIGFDDFGGIQEKSLPEMIGYYIGIFIAVLGLVLLGLLIYGGFVWMLARGDEAEVTKAKNIIRNAIIGAIVVLGAYGITMLFYEIWVVAQNFYSG